MLSMNIVDVHKEIEKESVWLLKRDGACNDVGLQLQFMFQLFSS